MVNFKNRLCHEKLQTRIYLLVLAEESQKNSRGSAGPPASVMSHFQRHLNFYVISGLCPRPDPYQEIDIDLKFLVPPLRPGNVGSQTQISHFLRLISVKKYLRGPPRFWSAQVVAFLSMLTVGMISGVFWATHFDSDADLPYLCPCLESRCSWPRNAFVTELAMLAHSCMSLLMLMLKNK